MNWQWFWMERHDLPEGLGYPAFGKTHLLTLFFCLLFVILSAILFSRSNRKRQSLTLRFIPLLLLAMEIGKSLFLWSLGRYNRYYLPLNLCSLGIPVFLLQQFCRPGRWKEFWSQLSLSIIPLGGLVALLAPNWIDKYPPLNFLSLHSYLWHCLLLLFPLCLRISGQAKLEIRRWYVSLFLLAVLFPMMRLINRALDANYLFVSSPHTGTAFDVIGEKMGDPGYLLGYFGILLAVLWIYYLTVWMVEKTVSKIRNKRHDGGGSL